MEQKKYRHELKFVCSEQQLALVENRIKAICKQDSHCGEDGQYTIQSVYFDDYGNTCYYENENGTDPREKYRIRIYNGSMERIALECKQKQCGMNHKESVLLSSEVCESILKGTWNACDVLGDVEQSGNNLLRKFALLYHTKNYRGKIIVQYNRTPYIYSIGNVRITFDRNISVTKDLQLFGKSVRRLRPVMPMGYHVLEVKYDEVLPDYIHNLLQIERLRQTAYSKYYICRKYCF